MRVSTGIAAVPQRPRQFTSPGILRCPGPAIEYLDKIASGRDFLGRAMANVRMLHQQETVFVLNLGYKLGKFFVPVLLRR